MADPNKVKMMVQVMKYNLRPCTVGEDTDCKILKLVVEH